LSNPELTPPWQCLSSDTVFNNPWIQVRSEKVRGPGGANCDYGLVHFKHLAVGIVAVDAADNIILVGQHRYPLAYYSWEIPEGGCPEGESLESAAQRELREETGLQAERWNYLGCLALSNSVSDEVAHFFLARNLTHGHPTPETNEVLQQRWISLNEACEQALNGVLNESLTVTAVLRARHFLEREKSGLPFEPYSSNP
jgi:8-oxo-dGTP pyrophosphatase MutT (NUDIX family)